MNLYEYYRGPVDPTAVYRAWKGDREVRYTVEPGENSCAKGFKLLGCVPTGTERVREPAPLDP